MLRHGLRFCGHCLGCFFWWTLWLGLGLLLGFQIYTATTKQMPVPPFLLRSLEQQLSNSELSAQLGKTSFDPTGQIVIQDLRLSLPRFAEPVAQVRSLYIQLDPLALLTGRVQADALRANGLSLYIPALLSGSGARELLIENAELALSTREHALEFTEFSAQSAQLGNLALSIQGRVDPRPLIRTKATETLPAAELFARYYPLLCRRLGEAAQWTAGLHPSTRIDIALSPDDVAGAFAEITITGNGYDAPKHASPPFSLGAFRVTSSPLPLHSTAPVPLQIDLALRALDLELPPLPPLPTRVAPSALPPHFALRQNSPIDRQARVLGLRGTLRGLVDFAQMRVRPQALAVAAAELRFAGASPRDISLQAELDGWPRIRSAALLQIGGAPLDLDARFTLGEPDAQLHASGRLPPALLDLASEYTSTDLSRFVRLGAAPEIDLELRIAGGRLAALTGRFDARAVWAHGLTLDQIGGRVTFSGKRFEAPQAYAAIGSNYAHGSYTQDLGTRDYRFLLSGQLNPPDISLWFHDWWAQFWQNFDLSKNAPTASVDVRGRWGEPQHSRVFVYADSHSPTIEGAALDQVRTRIYIKPDYYHAMELSIRRGTQSANGWFLRRNDPATRQLAREDFDFSSTLDMPTLGALSGPEVQAAIAPFYFAEPVSVKARGFIAAAGARHIDLHGSTKGDFTFYDFPLNGLNFTAMIDDDMLLVDSLSAGLAEGLVSGRVLLQGTGEAQTLGFDLSLAQGKFYKWTGIVSDYLARRRGEEPPPNVEKNTNVTIDLDLSAEGRPGDTLSFMGSGNMELKGRGLGEIHIFGLLSELLNFTALHFNRLLTSFSIEGDKIVFPEVHITGSNSAITASGHYALDRGQLDFRARINPFQESRSILKTIAGLMLTPISNVLEVRLTGPLDNPKWNFLHFSSNPATAPNNPNAASNNAAAPAPEENPPQAEVPETSETGSNTQIDAANVHHNTGADY
ncbi:AsmA-like C-terminal region-containing protein [Cephaloticoccus primus]|uniref:AsmA-like C-terminal region-containing protein n=1 Tax=Cephaloticoccus primus TaxID=1548207 RepID=UPI0012E84BB2|nr:AsmA-like C-terminal region-containing protein [Cephaloticoccus primus]